MELEKYLTTLELQIDRFVPFEELPDPLMRKMLSKYSVGFDNDADFKLTQSVFLSKFEAYGIAPSDTALYLTLIDPVRKCYILTKTTKYLKNKPMYG